MRPCPLVFFSGLFQVNNVTGELWCMKALDREAVASYELTIGCRELTTETRRQEKRETTGQYMVTSSRGTVAQWTESLTLTWVGPNHHAAISKGGQFWPTYIASVL